MDSRNTFLILSVLSGVVGLIHYWFYFTRTKNTSTNTQFFQKAVTPSVPAANESDTNSSSTLKVVLSILVFSLFVFSILTGSVDKAFYHNQLLTLTLIFSSLVSFLLFPKVLEILNFNKITAGSPGQKRAQLIFAWLLPASLAATLSFTLLITNSFYPVSVTSRDFEIVEKFENHHRSKTRTWVTFHLKLRDLSKAPIANDFFDTGEIQVTPNDFKNAIPHETRVSVTLSKGILGFEQIQVYSLVKVTSR